ncbi:MAG: flagellin hook IN motif-containing protein, partial [Pseudomonadota bacterium]
MSVIASLQNLVGFARIRTSSTPAPGLKPHATVDVDARIEALRARTQLLRLYRSLESLAEASGVRTSLNFGPASARSDGGLSLDLTQTAASLSSSDEINNAPMSFSPFGPDWDGASTAPITIGGEYDGSHGSGDLFFEVRWAGTRGEDDLRIRVEDPDGNRIRNVTIRTNHALDRQYDLRNGLYLTLGDGDLINRDTTRIQIRDDLGATVNPDNPLGGIRNSNPNLQFGGPSIVDGQFTINGETISVATTDSVNDVINRINQSAAGVSATFNAASDSIDFANNTLGSSGVIDLQGDTSNFLAATKLDSTNVVAGIDPETAIAMDQVAAFSSVRSGNIVINNTQIAVDTSVDSLDAVIDRINASEAGVTASFDTATQQFRLETRGQNQRLAVDGNATGLFAALNLLENNDYSAANGRGFSRQRSYQIANSFTDVFAHLNDVFKGSSAVSAPLGSALRGALGENYGRETFGLT